MSDAPAERSADAQYEALANRRRRRCLDVLRSHSSTVSERRLATELAREGADDDANGADDRERELVTLVHCHLPKLDGAGFVDWDRDESTVALASDLPMAESRFRRLLDLDGAHWDAVVSALSSERRRAVVDVLEDATPPLAGSELARRVAAREAGTSPPAVPDETVRSVRISLHHVHLPKLARIDVVEREDGAVRYDGHPAFDTDLLRSENDGGQLRSTGDLSRAD